MIWVWNYVSGFGGGCLVVSGGSEVLLIVFVALVNGGVYAVVLV